MKTIAHALNAEGIPFPAKDPALTVVRLPGPSVTTLGSIADQEKDRTRGKAFHERIERGLGACVDPVGLDRRLGVGGGRGSRGGRIPAPEDVTS
jgi:hypothetical protein